MWNRLIMLRESFIKKRGILPPDGVLRSPLVAAVGRRPNRPRRGASCVCRGVGSPSGMGRVSASAMLFADPLSSLWR